MKKTMARVRLKMVAVRVDTEVWRAVKLTAAARGETAAAVVDRALRGELGIREGAERRAPPPGFRLPDEVLATTPIAPHVAVVGPSEGIPAALPDGLVPGPGSVMRADYLAQPRTGIPEEVFIGPLTEDWTGNTLERELTDGEAASAVGDELSAAMKRLTKAEQVAAAQAHLVAHPEDESQDPRDRRRG